ncbi:hypothetical protein BC830DRAFT_1167916 [Chytriomyces sp. MP71]|nr:hypothetical protein BC830DRAFT_1167916 [Chytriomyces sp. MP71]
MESLPPSPNHTKYPTLLLDAKNDEAKVTLSSSSSDPLVSLAFKLEESRFGQLTYLRLYQGTLRKGEWIVNVRTGKKVKVPRLVRMHLNEMEDVDSVGSEEICALFGIDAQVVTHVYVCAGPRDFKEPKGKESANFSKALNRFTREDPMVQVHVDNDRSRQERCYNLHRSPIHISFQTIISGMGELDIHLERMKREYNTESHESPTAKLLQTARNSTIRTKSSQAEEDSTEK